MARPALLDTHVHFHDLSHPSLRWDWLDVDAPVDSTVGPDFAIRSRRYLPEDFLAETRFQRVAGVVHVQAALGSPDPVEETRWLQALADACGTPHAIVGYVDLARDDVEEQLARHRESPRFRGVRDLRCDDYLDNPSWRAGYAKLAGLVCCDDPFIEDAEKVRRLAEANPEVTLCIDHACFPGLAGRPREHAHANESAWRAAIRLLAGAENVVMKISGLGVSDHRFTAASIRPWIAHCLETFGARRCVLGSDWPLGRLYGSYGDTLAAYDEALSDLDGEEREAVFRGNAERIFAIEAGAR